MNSSNIWQLIQVNLATYADSIAVSAEDRDLSYQELEIAVSQFANYLLAEGVCKGDRVGILLPRNSELIVSILGVLSIGACYVPLSDRYPKARNQMIIDASGCQYLIGADHFENVKQLSAHSNRTVLNEELEVPATLSSHDMAYIIYTSGSTGKPKGVMISHANALSLIQWAISQYDQTALSYTLASTSICFDLSVFEIFAPLVVGGCVVLVDNALALLNGAPKKPISLINTVPSALRTLLAHSAIPDSVRILNLAGEALEQSLVDSVYQTTLVDTVYNLYGPSETTTYSTYYLAEKNVDRVMVPIGKPITGTHIYLLDKHQQPVPPLAKGEIYIAGPGVTLGYCNRPEETSARYIILARGNTSVRAYRTGDLARMNHATEFEYLGRLDQQIKIHGFRIELDEIIQTIQSHDAVKQAFVMVNMTDSGEPELVAYVALNDQAMTDTALRHWVSQWLPDYMIPQQVLFLEALPLNDNGKIDRHALPLPRRDAKQELVEYQTSVERDIADIWKVLLAHTAFDRQSNFFYVGGHSLLAARLLAKFKSQFQIECQLEELFRYSTIEAQALMIAKRLETVTSSVLPALLGKRPDNVPLSYGQERLWYLHSAIKSIPISNIPVIIKIQGQLDVSAFESSINKIIERHEILRTVYVSVDHQVVQRVKEQFLFQLNIENIQDSTGLGITLATEANLAFDLSQDLMIRARLFVLSKDESILLITQHHIASDAWSLNILMHELSQLYRTYYRKESVAQLNLKIPVQFSDYSCWQRALMDGPIFQDDLAYWKKQLEDAPQSIKLPFDRNRGELQTYSGAFYSWELEQSFVEKLKAVANQHQCTLFMILLAAFDVLVYRYSEQNDFCIGILSANRPLDELSHSLGFFVNTLVTRHQVNGGMTGEELLSQVRNTVLDSLAHQQLPFDKLVEALRPSRQLNQHPFFHVLFSLQNALDTHLTLDGLKLDVSEYDRQIAKFDLTLSMVEDNDKLLSIFEYNTDLFDLATIEQMTAHYIQILLAFTHTLSVPVNKINLLSDSERQFLLVDLNQEQQREIEGPNIPVLFEKIVHAYADKIAIIAGEDSLTYQQLDQQANQLARILIDYGVSLGTPIGILLPRSINTVVSILAVLKAGGYYVPMDPAWPTERLDFIIRDTEAPLIITNNVSILHLPSSPMVFPLNLDDLETTKLVDSILQPSIESTLDDACYVMYTSGSTGKPKGVVVKHSGVVRLVRDTNYVQFDSNQRILQVSPLAFDGSTFDLWGSLLNGATLVLMPDGMPELGKLAHHLMSHKITTLFLTPQLFHSLVDNKLDSMATLTQILLGGDVASVNHVARFKNQYPHCALTNGYGPTECTTFALSYLVPPDFERDKPLPLGRPISNTCAVILSDEGQICPINVPGEIYLGGAGLAKGYLNQATLTEKQFIQNPFIELSTSHLYRTGDLGYYHRDGQIIFLGRVDNQIKLRGYRIELTEIEHALREVPNVLDAVVILQKPENTLVAYINAKSNVRFDIKAIRQNLSKRLPLYMLPDALQCLDAFPLNNNGKVDKDKLPRWVCDIKANRVDESLLQGNEAAMVIHGIWATILENTSIKINDNFFEIGGNSLKILLVLDLLQEHYKANTNIFEKLDIVTLFQYPTIHDLATHLSASTQQQIEAPNQHARVHQRDKRKAARLVEQENADD